MIHSATTSTTDISDVPLIRMNVSVNLITHLPESLHLMKSLELLVLHDNPLVFPPPHVCFLVVVYMGKVPYVLLCYNGVYFTRV